MEEIEQLARLPAKLSDIDIDIKDDPLIGMHEDEVRLLNLLLDKSVTRRVLQVVDMVEKDKTDHDLFSGGSDEESRTHLVARTCNRPVVKHHFDLFLWINIGQNIRLNDVLVRLLRGIRIQCGLKLSGRNENDESLFREIHQFLMCKKFLIVFDDVWSAHIFFEIIEKLPDAAKGSRIIMICRSPDITIKSIPGSEIYLIGLDQDEALGLVLRIANLPDNIQDRNDLTIIAKKLAEECHGIPMLLTILGGLLSKRPPTSAAWREVLVGLEGGHDPMRLFNFAYEELSYVPKLCFNYFAKFPTNYKVNCTSLMRMWIAEGFIPPENTTSEDTAESLLVELAQRRLIKISRRSHDDSFQCYMDGIFHGIAVEKANNIGSYKNSSIRCSSNNSSIPGKTHSLFCFKSVPYNDSPTTSKKIFRNIDGTTDLRNFEEIDQVRYLEISCGRDSMKGFFDKLISRMKFIQTLDLRASQHGDLPDIIWNIQTLKHILLSGYTAGPPSLLSLENLRTLLGVTNRESWQVRTPNLPNLRDLDILLYEGFQGAVLANFINKLEHLNSLKIVGDEIPLKADNLRSCKFSNNLQILHMRVYKAFSNIEALDTSMFPINLIELKLENCQIEKDPMPILGKLGHLKKLQLRYRACNDKTMSCSSGCFGNLKELEFFALVTLEEWEINEGSMPELEKLTFSCCRNLNVPQGLKYLTKLRALTWLLHKEPEKEGEIYSISKLGTSVCVRELHQ